MANHFAKRAHDIIGRSFWGGGGGGSFALPQQRVAITAAVKHAANPHHSLIEFKCDGDAPFNAENSQSRTDVVSARATIGEFGQVLHSRL